MDFIFTVFHIRNILGGFVIPRDGKGMWGVRGRVDSKLTPPQSPKNQFGVSR